MKNDHNYFLLKHPWLFYLACALMIVLGALILRYPHHSVGNCAETNVLISRIKSGLEKCCERRGEITQETERVIELPEDEEIQEQIGGRRDEFGGSTGYLTVSLMWNNTDDLDLAVVMPNKRDTIYYNRPTHISGGRLDVDKNTFGYPGRPVPMPVMNPLENINWKEKPPSGEYQVLVSLFGRRTTSRKPVPFTIQVIQEGKSKSYSGKIATPSRKFKKQNIELHVR